MAQRGWFYVIVGLLISSFLGGAIHVFFSPERVRHFVETKLSEKQPKFNIEFKSARLQLADNWWPTIAVELEGIAVRAKDPCITNSSIYIDQLVIPIQMSMLFSIKKKYGHVRAGQLRFFVRPATCTVKKHDVSSDNKNRDDFASLENFFQNRWSKEVINTTRYLDELSIDSLEILRDDQALSPALASNVNMRFLADKGESTISFAILIGKPWVGEVELGPVKVSAQVGADFVTLKGKGNLKEGQFQIFSEWAVDRGDISLKVFSQDLPTQNVLNLMHHWGIVPELNPTLKNQWLSCDITMQGSIRNFLNLPIDLHQCRLYGDLGEMVVKTIKIGSLKTGGDFFVQIQDLNVKAVLSGLGLQSHWGVISQFGRFTGDLRIFNKVNYELVGDIRGSELYRVNSSGQLRQKLDRFFLKLNFDGSKFVGSANNFSIEAGHVKGGVDFVLSPSGDGHFKINLSEMQLPGALQKLLWGGVLSNIDIQANGETGASKIKKINADVTIRDYQSNQWEMKKIKLLTKFSDSLWAIQLTASDLQLQPESKWYAVLQNLISFSHLKGHKASGDGGVVQNRVIQNIVVQNIKTEMIVTDSDSKVEWKNLSAALSDYRLLLSSEGRWTADQGLDALIKTRNSKKSVTGFIFGELGSPQIKFAGVP